MSYILEALRKSERERQLGQAPSLPVLLAGPPPQRQRWMTWVFLALLLAINGAFWWYFGRGDAGDSSSIPQAADAAQRRKTGASANSREKMQGSDIPSAEAETPKTQLGVAEKSVTAVDSFSSAAAENKQPQHELFEKTGRTAIRSAPKKSAAATGPASAKQPSTISVPPALTGETAGKDGKPEKNSGWLRGSEYTQNDERLPDVAVLAQPDTSQKPDNAAASGARHETIPLLSAMPAAFQQRIPPLSINVLAYSSVPKERFAVINMVKYSSGDRVPGGAVLLEIRSDSLVLYLDGSKFRIPQR